MIRLRTLVLAAAMASTVTACQKHFEFALYTTSEATYSAALAALNAGHPRQAAEAFERLTLQLGARDTLLSRSYWYLGVAQMQNKEWQLAGNAFRRIYAQFSTDSLADDGLLAAARASRRLWPNPELDDSYGLDAKALLSTLMQTYPNSSLREEVFKELDALDDAFAIKKYEAARGYFRNKAWYSSTVYLKEVIELYPATPTALKSRIMLVRASQKMQFAADVEEHCKYLREMHRNDREVQQYCSAAPVTTKLPP